MRVRLFAAALGVLLLVAGPAPAQIAWDAPYLVPPAPPAGFGLYLVDVHRGELGAMGAWRARTGRHGFRIGLAEAAGGDLGVFGGVDFTGRVTRANANFPLDVDWIFGAGLGIADWTRLSVPVGLTLGRTFRDAGTAFTPYFTPRVFLDAAFDRGRDDDSDADLGLAVDLGLDLRFARSGLVVRFGASLGDRDALGIGLIF